MVFYSFIRPHARTTAHMSDSVIVGLFTFLLGLVLGHRLTLWREQRREFNEVATRVRVALRARLSNPSPYFGTAGRIDASDLEMLEHLLGPWGRTKYRKAKDDYEAECKKTRSDTLGQVSYENPSVISSELAKVLKTISLR